MLLLDQHYAKGFPTWMMDARVLPVSKQQGATSPKYTRPITILPIIYRLWSRVLARKNLAAWKYQLSDSITGFVPGRNSLDFVYRMQLHLEATQHGHCQQHWGGITLDLTKCFNTLPQEPLCHILIRLGVPTRLEALKKKQEAIQFSRFKDENPLEQWVVCSLPNLYFGRVETLSSCH